MTRLALIALAVLLLISTIAVINDTCGTDMACRVEEESPQ